MVAREEPLVERLEREPGRKEARYVQRLVEGTMSPSAPRATDHENIDVADDVSGTSLAMLEQEVAELRAEVAALRDEVRRLAGG